MIRERRESSQALALQAFVMHQRLPLSSLKVQSREMPSIQDSIDSIRASLRDHDYATQSHEQTQRQHERILDEYAHMTRHRSTRMREERGSDKTNRYRETRHERNREQDRRTSRSPPSMRFRFKDGKSSGRKRHKPSRHGSNPDDKKRNLEQYAAHPLPRPSTSTSPQPEPNTARPADPDLAFRESLFDAMADDEGAAYWQAVYGDSIHSYPRPCVKDEQGHLEKMTDDQYVEYVKAKMWEKKNPELLRERQAREQEASAAGAKRKREYQEEEEDFEWVGSAENGYERRYTSTRRPKPSKKQKHTHHGEDQTFMSDVDAALARGAKRKELKKWQQAWSSYQQSWQELKTTSTTLQGEQVLKSIAWPVSSLKAADVSTQNVQDFFINAPLESEHIRSKTLKDESVNWHPDRFQRRFGGGNVDDETLKLATSVFQTIYDMWERTRPSKG
jgi:hypothetical protein